MTQEELGERIGVQKSAIRKYEKGVIENIKRSSIKIMANIFGVSPTYLMGWDDEENSSEVEALAEEVKLLERIQSQYGERSIRLLKAFNDLGVSGQETAIHIVEDLLDVPKYRKEEAE